MKRSRSLAWMALSGCFVWILAGGCSSSDGDDAGSGRGPSAGGGDTGNKGGGPTMLEPDASVSGGSSNDDIHPLCGEGSCQPDDANACRNYEPPEAAGGSGAGGQGGAPSGSDASGAGGQSSGGAGGESSGGVGGESSAGGGSAAGGAPPSSGGEGGAASSGGGSAAGEGGASTAPPVPLPSYSCQVTRQGSAITRACSLAGSGGVNAPCLSASDCAPSLACVTEGDAGRCLPYCCGVGAVCAGGTYCAERPLRRASGVSSGAGPELVPVCVPTDDCSLEDQYPCPTGAECRCKGNTACMVVRDDGTTTCLEPGTGQQGEACPCAWNHVCSSVTKKCVKICRTDPASSDCGEQKCQASSELPPNFGVCVGPVK